MGLECARELRDVGHLLLVDVDDASLDRAVRGLDDEGIGAEALRCDITVPAEIDHLAERVASLGALRALVHTAGVSPMMAGPQRVLDVDLGGTVRLLDALLPLTQPRTAVVCIASSAGHVPLPPEVAALLDDPLSETLLADLERTLGMELESGFTYAIAKHGVIRSCERYASAFGACGGRIVSIAPGLMDTEMGRLELSKQPVMVEMAANTPVQRDPTAPLPGRASDIAAAVAFLCSDRASFISGCDLRVDGGLIGSSHHPDPAG
jgi:NAD(P)-dependent dehydrogenase (short-subunit alcohol dehydrogenase family)